MKLIDEKEVEEAALRRCDNIYEQVGFIFGASFAEQKLQPMMVEFAEWCSKSGYSYNYRHRLWYHGVEANDTTEKLLEQFLKNKQK